MTEEQLKQMLTEETNAAAPDKEALWTKIDAQLKPKAAPVKRSAVPQLAKITGLAAACIAAVLLVPAIFNLVKLTNGNIAIGNKSDVSSSQSCSSSYQSNYSPSNNADSSPAEELPNTKLLRYDELSFPSYSQTLLKCSGKPFGDEYFVEQDILAKTDVIIRARVNKVYNTDDNSGICYDVTVTEAFSEAEISSSLTVVSHSPYPMRRGRDYLLLLNEDENGYHTVFDNVPQTEYTADGGIVYFNGWQSLTTNNSRALIYSEQPDAFFYDRMMYSTNGNPSSLIAAWSEIRNLQQI
ncbi:MAG: hypothetical protein ACI4JZ_01155 [Oscillospiraceae bacterium]